VRLRIGALWLSAISFIILLCAHIVYAFEFDGKIMPLPSSEMVYAVLLAPWCGEGIGRLLGMAKKTDK
jgi:hypothetical protein